MLRGPFGKRVAGVSGGRVSSVDVEKFLEKLQRIDKEEKTTSQLFDASHIAGLEHLLHSARLALIAQATGMNFADSPNIELLCWVAAERQISRAFEKVGLRRDSDTAAILVLGDSKLQVKKVLEEIHQGLGIKREDGVLELTEQKIPKLIKSFSISKEEMKFAPVRRLILERVALLALEK